MSPSIPATPRPPPPERAVRALLPGLLAALLQQRGLLVLHASAGARKDSAVGVAGASGVGKSTLVARLLDTGWQQWAG
jgi:ABC-type protease/lipase transport system fused ATPase/permease subunit